MSTPLTLHNRCRLRRAIADTVGILMEDFSLRLLNNLDVFFPSIGYERQRMIDFARDFVSTGSLHVFEQEQDKTVLLFVLRCFLQLEDYYADSQRISKSRYGIKRLLNRKHNKTTSQDGLSSELCSSAIDQEYPTNPTPPFLAFLAPQEYNTMSSSIEQGYTNDSIPYREYTMKRSQPTSDQPSTPPKKDVLPIPYPQAYTTKTSPSPTEPETSPLHELLVGSFLDPEPASLSPLDLDQCSTLAHNHFPEPSSNDELPHFNTDSSTFRMIHLLDLDSGSVPSLPKTSVWRHPTAQPVPP
jgi:hypothetical protein